MTNTPDRRRFDPLGVFVGLLLIAIVALVGAVVTGTGSTKAPIATTSSEDKPRAVAAPPAADFLERIEMKPATTEKGKLLKRELRKKAESDVAKTRRTDVALTEPAAGFHDVVLSGDARLSHAFKRQLKGVRITDDGTRGFQLSLRAVTGSGDDGTAFAKCSAAISKLPGRRLLASVSARADAGGDGSLDSELASAALDACADSLVVDVTAWIRAHR